MPLAKKIDETIATLKKKLRSEESFDLIYRTITVGGKGACLFFIDGLVKDEVMEKIMEFFYGAKPEDMTDAHSFVKTTCLTSRWPSLTMWTWSAPIFFPVF